MMFNYQEEMFRNIKSELEPILKEHWEELANHKDSRPLDVDYEGYEHLNDVGIFKILTARNEKDELIGYACFMISYNMHYKNWKYALCDVYYVKPEYRKSGLGTEFFKEIVAWLKGQGIRSVLVQDKLNHSHEKFFKTLGFTPIEQVYEMVF